MYRLRIEETANSSFGVYADYGKINVYTRTCALGTDLDATQAKKLLDRKIFEKKKGGYRIVEHR
jgi:hypothetical protein